MAPLSHCSLLSVAIIFVGISLSTHHSIASHIARHTLDLNSKTTSRATQRNPFDQAESPTPDATPSVTPTISPASLTPSPDIASPTPASPSAASEAIGSSIPVPSSAITSPIPTPDAASTTAETPATTGSTEEIEAFEAFRLQHYRENDGDSPDAFDDQLVFANGTLVGSFAKNPASSSLDLVAGTSDVKWYSDADYLDRIAFRFTFNIDSPAYTISKPQLFTSSLAGIAPRVVNFHIDAEDGFGSFTVMYRCRPAGAKKNLIAMHLPITGAHAVDTIWIKTCGSGHFHYLTAGFMDHNGYSSEFNPDGSLGEEERRKLEVGPMDASTQFHVHLKPPAEILDFMKPFLESLSNNVDVQLRGSINAGTLSADGDTSFTVLYDCKKATSTTVRLTMAIPPWDNVTIEWRKDCGGSHSQALEIGTTGPRSYDVMQAGELSADFNVSDDTTVDTVHETVEVVPPNKNSFRLYLSNDDSTSDIHFQTISLTMSNPEVLEARVVVPTIAMTSNYFSQNGGVLGRHESKSLLLHFICKTAGKSILLVTLPTVRYKNVEFGFVKECDEPMSHYDSGFLTAGSLLTAFLVLLIGSGCGLCYCTLRKRRAIKYESVPTSEA